jgi:NADH:ubiquinone oxidoreductase subunit 4 (subunit M)
VILASAVLAIATLTAWSQLFLGPPRKLLAPDLAPRERWVLAVLLLVLLVLGLVPQVLMTPVNEVLGVGPVVVHVP